MKKSITLTRTYDVSVAKLWRALTSAEALSIWLMPTDFEPVLGHRFTFQTKPSPGFDGVVRCEVLELDPERKLSFSWSGGSLKDTIVTFNLTPYGNRTQLHFEHRGFEGIVNRLLLRNLLASGWKGKILTKQLDQYLAHV